LGKPIRNIAVKIYLERLWVVSVNNGIKTRLCLSGYRNKGFDTVLYSLLVIIQNKIFFINHRTPPKRLWYFRLGKIVFKTMLPLVFTTAGTT
jgi:hypothetical protein